MSEHTDEQGGHSDHYRASLTQMTHTQSSTQQRDDTHGQSGQRDQQSTPQTTTRLRQWELPGCGGS